MEDSDEEELQQQNDQDKESDIMSDI